MDETSPKVTLADHEFELLRAGHTDRHGDQFTIEALEDIVVEHTAGEFAGQRLLSVTDFNNSASALQGEVVDMHMDGLKLMARVRVEHPAVLALLSDPETKKTLALAAAGELIRSDIVHEGDREIRLVREFKLTMCSIIPAKNKI